MEQNKRKVFLKLDDLPSGFAGDDIIPGCIVLEGGAFRSLHQEGFLDALMESGINLSCAVGTSAGSLNGFGYICGNIGKAAYLNLKYRRDPNYVSVRNYLKTGCVIGFDYIMKNRSVNDGIPFREERLKDPRRRFVAVCTNVETGEAEYLERTNCDDLYAAMKASSSIPYFMRMLEIDGKKYLDGGCSDRIPYQWAIDQGYEKIIVVKTKPDSYREKKKTKVRHMGEYAIYRKYPNLAEKIINRAEIYNRQVEELDRLRDQGTVFVVAPEEPMQCRSLENNMETLGDLYFEGFNQGMRMIGDIKRYLGLPDNEEELKSG